MFLQNLKAFFRNNFWYLKNININTNYKIIIGIMLLIVIFSVFCFLSFTFYFIRDFLLCPVFCILFICFYIIKTYVVLLILFIIKQLFFFLSVVIPVLIGVAYFTLAERKVMGAIQRRLGPNVIGFWGVFQPLADGLKLVVKQTIVPNKSQRILFLFAPVYTFALALTAWSVIPFSDYQVVANIELGVIFLLTVSTLSVYGLIIAGWSSNSKYAFLGALRSAAQIISYDVSIGLILLTLLLCTNSCNLIIIVNIQQFGWFIIPFWPLFFIFFVSSLAETNRAPFDLTEAEAELVAGYNVEYSAVGFALFFLAEYSNILLISIYMSILFLGGWLSPFSVNLLEYFNLICFSFPSAFWLGIKVLFIAFLFIWVRASLPRYRYDQLMFLGWKIFLPISLAFFIFFSVFLFI